MISGLVDGLRTVGRSWGLVLLLLAVNVSVAAVLAIPLAGVLEDDLRNTDSAVTMLYGFDHGWWSQWADEQSGWTESFRPDLFGAGFAVKNLDLLLKGELPGGFFSSPAPGAEGESPPGRPDSLILGLGLLCLLVHTFLLGGVLGVLRSQSGHWTVRGLLHGSGFYFGRLVRVALLALLGLYLVFLVNGMLASWVDDMVREAVSETTATTWVLARHALLLLAILFVAMISSYAKVILVLEERSSALLAVVSSFAFCLGNLLRTAGHYLTLTALGVVLVVVWSFLDGHWLTVGYRTQIVSLLLAQALIFGRIWLRLALIGGQISIYRRLSGIPSSGPAQQ